MGLLDNRTFLHLLQPPTRRSKLHIITMAILPSHLLHLAQGAGCVNRHSASSSPRTLLLVHGAAPPSGMLVLRPPVTSQHLIMMLHTTSISCFKTECVILLLSWPRWSVILCIIIKQYVNQMQSSSKKQ